MPDAAIKSVTASAYTIPTDAPEADGTFAWNSTTLVLAEVHAGGKTGIGYSYTDAGAAAVVNGALAEAVVDLDAFRIPLAHEVMLRRIRNIGRPDRKIRCGHIAKPVDPALCADDLHGMAAAQSNPQSRQKARAALPGHLQ